MAKAPEKHHHFSAARALRSRQWWMEQLKTLGLVIPLTCLIWIYAERAQIWSDKAQVYIDVVSADPSLYAQVIDPSDQSVTVELSGPRNSVEKLKNRLEARTGDRRFRVTLPASYRSSDEPNIPVTSLLNDDAEINSSGVTVTAAAPSTVKVAIEQLVTRDVPIQMPPDLPVTLQNVVLSPPTVQVRGPKNQIDQLYGRPNAAIYADLTNVSADLLTPGPHNTKLPLVLPREPSVTANVSSVTARFEVAARDAEYTIASLPILIEVPLPLQGRVKVKTNRLTMTNVRVKGPAEAVARLRPGPNGAPPASVPVAVIRIDTDDRLNSVLPKPVKIHDLPPGVTVVGPTQELECSIEPLDAADNG